MKHFIDRLMAIRVTFSMISIYVGNDPCVVPSDFVDTTRRNGTGAVPYIIWKLVIICVYYLACFVSKNSVLFIKNLFCQCHTIPICLSTFPELFHVKHSIDKPPIVYGRKLSPIKISNRLMAIRVTFSMISINM